MQTDIKRARFRADSTIYDDKLTSCLKLNCRGIRDRLPQPGTGSARQGRSSLARRSNPSPARSHAVESVPRATRKRSRKSLKDGSDSASEDDREDPCERPAARKGQSKQKQKEDDTSMVVDDPPPSRAKPHARAKASSRPPSRARPPRSTSSIVSSAPGPTNAVPPLPPLPLLSRPTSVSVLMQGNASAPRKPRSDAVAKPKTISRMLVSQSDVHAVSDSDTSLRARPRTRSLGREHSDARDIRSYASVLARNPSQVRRPRRAAKQASEDELVMTSQDEARGRKKRRTGA